MVFSLFATEGYAAHTKGAEIEYKCLGGNLYEITLIYYHDCTNGVGAPSTGTMNNNITISDGTNTLTDNFTRTGPVQISQVCATAVTSCDNSSTYDVEGVNQYIYKQYLGIFV